MIQIRMIVRQRKTLSATDQAAVKALMLRLLPIVLRNQRFRKRRKSTDRIPNQRFRPRPVLKERKSRPGSPNVTPLVSA